MFVPQVPQYPILGYVLGGAALVGVPSALQAFFTRGPKRSKVAVIIGMGLTGFIGYTALTEMGNVLFVWHVIGMIFAIFTLQPCAVHMIHSRKSETDPDRRLKRVKSHKNLQIASMIAATVGFLAVFLNKPAGFPGKHFMSVHALVGLLGLCLMALNITHSAIKQGNPFKPKVMWTSFLHRFLGSFAFVACITAACLGMYNRTVVIDWEARPLTFSIPETWWVMEGWGRKVMGAWYTQSVISGAMFLIPLMLWPGKAPPPKAPKATAKKETKKESKPETKPETKKNK